MDPWAIGPYLSSANFTPFFSRTAVASEVWMVSGTGRGNYHERSKTRVK